MSNLLLPEVRAQIISSVLNEGLQSGSYQSNNGKKILASGDPKLNNSIHGSIVYYYEDKERLEKSIRGALYRDTESSLPVLMERPFEFGGTPLFDVKDKKDSVTIDLLMRRVQASLAVLIRLGKIGVEGMYPDLSQIRPEVFDRVVIPENIWVEYQGLCQNKVESGESISVTGGRLKRKIGWLPGEFEVPAYEDELRELLDGYKASIWFHVVRLPVEEDLVFL